MRKYTIIAVLAGLVLASCGQKDEERGASMTSGTPSTQESPKTADKPTEKPADKPADKPAEKPAEKPADKPAAAVSYDPSAKAADWQTPNKVKVQHILIGVSSSPQPIPGAIPLADAKAKAEGICDRIRKGEDITTLMKEFSQDPGPGIYSMVNSGPADMRADIYPRSRMAKLFGDVGFSLDVGECAIAPFDAVKSPYGFHVIKRLE